MFVRKKNNKSGVVSVQIIDKSSGKYRVVKTIGSSADPDQIDKLYHEGLESIHRLIGQTSLNFANHADRSFAESLRNSIKSHKLVGPELLLGRIFKEVGFDRLKDELFRHLVLARLVFPSSKLKTVEYLNRYFGINYGVDTVYRYMDELQDRHKHTLQQISYDHTLEVLGGVISIVFYDVTTIYFEAEQEDELRVTGFSKDGKHQHPQILLGLLVSSGGYPLAYEIYEGNKFEGHTMIPVLEAFKQAYRVTDLVVVADAGLMSTENVGFLESCGLSYIIGARLKNMAEDIVQKVLNIELEDGQQQSIPLQDHTKLIVSYSSKRARKDAYNRERGLKKLEAALKKGKLSKKHINNRGYNKYLMIQGNVDVAIDYDKFKQDAQWDGLKGYVTNTKYPPEQVIENYKQLWQIEKAFRISKTDLRIRPIFHRLAHRIQAHIAISFCAFKVYKELERQLSTLPTDKSPVKVIEILNSIFAIEVALPNSQKITAIPIITNDEQREILELFGLSI